MDIQQQKSYRVLLIGDSCYDIYHYGVCDRLSPEAPVPVIKEMRSETKPGMSLNVKSNIESFQLCVNYYTNSERINKHRFIDQKHNQHLLRWDENEVNTLSPFDVSSLLMDVDDLPDVVVISDYDKGFLPYEVCEELLKKIRTTLPDIPVFVDTKKKDLTCFEKCVIKINEKEFSELTKKPKEATYIVTLGHRGALYNGAIIATTPTEVFDVCGAGDVFLASLVYGYLKTQKMKKAINLANALARVSVSHMGTYIITDEDIECAKNDICF